MNAPAEPVASAAPDARPDLVELNDPIAAAGVADSIAPAEPVERTKPLEPRAPIDVIKVGGHEQDDPMFVAGLAMAVAGLHAEGREVVVVHGGGRAIGELQAKLGLDVCVVDGLRATDDAGMDVVEMVLSGLANKRLVAAFLAAGHDAMGLSGVDRGLIRCRRLAHAGGDLGRVGEVTAVRAEVLRAFLDAGVLPIVSPVALGEDGRSWNVNADTAAAAVAGAMGAARLLLVSNVPGILVGGRIAPRLDALAIEDAVAAGDIQGGMVPKVRAALSTVAAGVLEARVVDLAGLADGGGTTIVGNAGPALAGDTARVGGGAS